MKHAKLAAGIATACVVVVAAVVTTTTTPPSPLDDVVVHPAPTARPAQPASVDAPAPLGVFRGTEQPDRVDVFEQWLGHQVSYVLDYVGQAEDGDRTPWEAIDDPSSRCAAWAHDRRVLVLSVALLPTKRQTLVEGAKGSYDAHWQRFATSLVESGCGDAVLRLGWEFNGRFSPWAAGGHEADFVAYWRRVVGTLRAVDGQAFRFDWTVLAGNANADVEAAYPGDDVVDIVGLDAYDTSELEDPEARWNDQLERRYGLLWHAQFAAEHGKVMSFPEWGVTVRPDDDLGGGDAPAYVAGMIDWITTHDVAYAIYFDFDANDADHRLSDGQFPLAAAVLRQRAAELSGAPV